MVMKRSRLGSKGTCPCVGVLCFLAALFSALFATQEAAADNPPAAAIKGTPLVVPATVLGVSNPYLVRAAAPRPKTPIFLSEDIRDLARRVDRLARYGLDLNRRNTGPERLRLTLQSRFGGGVLKLSYRH